MRSVTARTERVPIKGEDSADGVSAYRKYDVRRHAQLQSSCSRRRLKREIETQKPRREISGSSVQTETLVTMAEENIFLFVPNLIGYARIVLALVSFYLMPCCPGPAVFCYLLSALLDAFDGHAARALNQGTKFGAMLDMLTDRCATMCLLVNLALLYPSYTFLFQLSMCLDVASHWLHLHSSMMKGATSHKAIDLSGNPILRLYYTSRPVLFFMCMGNELFYCLLYIMYYIEEPQDLLPELTDAAQEPPPEHIPPPPSTVDTAALSEEPVPVKPVTRPARPAHICSICNKQFKNSYNLRRHQSVHTGVKMKDRAAREKMDGGKAGARVERQTIPLSLLQLSIPASIPTAVDPMAQPSPISNQQTCESAFATKDRLRAHMIRHEDKVPCHICGKLLSPAYITDHMRVHNQSQHHVCHLCNRSFTTLTYLRVHAQKHHGQEWKESGVGRGSGPGGVLLCQLCGVHCKTPTQLQGHMATHANQTDPNVPCPISSSSSSVATVGVATPVSSPPVTVGLLVTDCSSIAPQSHS
ncbi:CDP-diacylglycerol--inositol 3-phosphatidyltransferase-like protein [Labeo rohita]|uniref:CDP-diacylglycerol--inositol 3-phosphatidyltransferase n=1 Tax=Labeo rohita TaxID=84645 RepID=A0A498P6U3_LABRO|nr:CDP-diacylglycerol--inositol 3-phosphatidyltransferase-like protein [Labeo rohita]